MVISKDSSKDNQEINDINTSSGISSNSGGSSSTTLFKKPIPKNSRKRQTSELQLQQERKKKVMIPSVEDKVSDLLSKNKQLKNELEKKNEEIDRLNAILKQYTKLLKDVPEQDVFVCLEQ
jgi:seryl-tRNA synthetase